MLRFGDLYRTPGFYGLAVWRDNFPVGAVIGNVEKTDEGEIYRLSELWVIPEERHKGYARQLLNELRERQSFCGVSRFYAAAEEEQAKALENLGFTDGGCLRIVELH